MQISEAVSIGNLLTLASFIVFVTVYVVNSRTSARILGQRLISIDEMMLEFKAELQRLRDVIATQAVQNERINNIDRRVANAAMQIDERMMAQGKRVDRLESKVFSLPG